jgi:aryl-alcohol dehydrogenase-like predicted oxidoreductase
VVEAAEAIAADRGATTAQVAIAWLLGVEGVTAPIIGPRTLDHLEGILGADTIELSADERARLEDPAPPPELYPHRMLTDQLSLPSAAIHLARPGRP